MRLKITLTHVAAAAALVLAAGLGQISATHAGDAHVKRQKDGTSTPEVVAVYVGDACPTEDSCYADYADGRWTIVVGSR